VSDPVADWEERAAKIRARYERTLDYATGLCGAARDRMERWFAEHPKPVIKIEPVGGVCAKCGKLILHHIPKTAGPEMNPNACWVDRTPQGVWREFFPAFEMILEEVLVR